MNANVSNIWNMCEVASLQNFLLLIFDESTLTFA